MINAIHGVMNGVPLVAIKNEIKFEEKISILQDTVNALNNDIHDGFGKWFHFITLIHEYSDLNFSY